MSPARSRDLVVLVADKNMEHAIRGILSRHTSLRIESVLCDIFVHPEKDPGCLLRSHEFLRPFQRSHDYALVVFDREGCGRDQRPRVELEQAVEQRLDESGWQGRSGVVAIDPELENWLWSPSPHVDAALGWRDHDPSLRSWLIQSGMLADALAKPDKPKRAVEEALQVVRKPRSSAVYQKIAQTVSLDRCTDPAFGKLKELLTTWFSGLVAELG